MQILSSITKAANVAPYLDRRSDICKNICFANVEEKKHKVDKKFQKLRIAQVLVVGICWFVHHMT